MPRLFDGLDLSHGMLHRNVRSETNARNILQKRRIHNCLRRSVSEYHLNLGWWCCRDEQCLWMIGPLDIMSGGGVERMCPRCGTTTFIHGSLIHARNVWRLDSWQVDPCGALTLRLHQPGLLQREARLRMRRESIAARLCYEKERMNTSRIRIYLCA